MTRTPHSSTVRQARTFAQPSSNLLPKVLVIDDDQDVLTATAQTLNLRGAMVDTATDAQDALARLDTAYVGVVLCDVRMPGLDGLMFFSRLRSIDADIPVILMTGHGDVDMAVQAMQDGAYDFISKPYSADRLWRSVQRAQEKRRLVLENRRLQAMRLSSDAVDRLIGMAPAMQRLRTIMENVADADVDVLIQGETGAGKDVVAQTLHDMSTRRTGPFVAINCGALPESVIESELFGHEAGAFTGAHKRRIGHVEFSSGGTLFLDEIESMPLSLQVKLLRVLETRSITPLGSNEVRQLDLRVMAASKTSLDEAARRGTFREDLYFRLNVVTLLLPPLRERREDIPLLFTRYVDLAAARFNRAAPAPSQATLDYLASHPWPGNVRELVHYAERYVLGIAEHMTQRGAPALPSPSQMPGLLNRDGMSLPQAMEDHEASLIRLALTRFNGDVRQTVEYLGIPRKTFYDKLQRHGIERSAYANSSNDDLRVSGS